MTAPPRRIRSSTPFCAPTARSAANIRSASPVGIRTTSRPSAAICTWETTAPFFCASPVKSSVLTCFPSSDAAIATIAPAVTMPPPPIPANRPRHGVARSGNTGRFQPGRQLVLPRLPLGRIVALRRVGGGGDEGRAEPLQTRQVGVATRGRNPALAAVFGVHRLDRDAVRLRGAIAAILADALVDADLHFRHRHRAALAAATLLRGADLVVDDHGQAGIGGTFGPEFASVPRVPWRPMPGGRSLAAGRRAGSSATMTILVTPSAQTCRAISMTVGPPSAGWPPVIATASL